MPPKIRRLNFLFAAALLLLPALVACNERNFNSVRETRVSLKSFDIIVSPNPVGAGNIIFHIKNESIDAVHEFHIVRASLPHDELPTLPDGNVDESKLDKLTDMAVIQPGQSGDLVVYLEAGRYVLMCNVPSHYKLGMHAELTVTP